jgi:hypothetical protein
MLWIFISSLAKFKEQDIEIAQKIHIIETYWHDHSLEGSGGAVFNGTITFCDSTMFGDAFSEFFS